MGRMQKNLTEGSVFRVLLVFSVPFFISYFLQTVYGLVDLLVIGRFHGADVITAVSVAFSVYCFVAFRQITFIWIFAGILGCYGTTKYNKLWNNYRKKGVLPPKVDR